MQIAQSMSNNELFCKQLNSYRGFRLGCVKLIVKYSFQGYELKIEQNNRELRYDIYLLENHKETGEIINLFEVERFQKFYGKGFNIIIWKLCASEFIAK